MEYRMASHTRHRHTRQSVQADDNARNVLAFPRKLFHIKDIRNKAIIIISESNRRLRPMERKGSVGIDDTAQKEFLNKRRIKGEMAGPGQSNSNLWFINQEELYSFGPTNSTGAVWLNEQVEAKVPANRYFSDIGQNDVHGLKTTAVTLSSLQSRQNPETGNGNNYGK